MCNGAGLDLDRRTVVLLRHPQSSLNVPAPVPPKGLSFPLPATARGVRVQVSVQGARRPLSVREPLRQVHNP